MRRHLCKLLSGVVLAIAVGGCGGGGGDNGGSSSPAQNTATVPTASSPVSLVGTTIRFTDRSGTHYSQYNFRANGYGNYNVVGPVPLAMGCVYAYQKTSGNTGAVKAWDYYGGIDGGTREDSYSQFTMTFQTSTSGTYSVTSVSPNVPTTQSSGSFQFL